MSARPNIVTRSRELETVLKWNLIQGYNEKVLWIGEGSGRCGENLRAAYICPSELPSCRETNCSDLPRTSPVPALKDPSPGKSFIPRKTGTASHTTYLIFCSNLKGGAEQRVFSQTYPRLEVWRSEWWVELACVLSCDIACHRRGSQHSQIRQGWLSHFHMSLDGAIVHDCSQCLPK